MIQIIKKYWITLAVITVLIGNYAYTQYRNLQDTKNELILENIDKYSEQVVQIQEDNINQEVKQGLTEVPIHLSGAVKHSGVYFIKEGSIVNEVIELAGGVTEEADINQINLARQVNANEKIYIPKIGEEIDKTQNSYDNRSSQVSDNTKININYASQTELDQLPGIGIVKAKQIIDYRNEVGKFKSCEELKNVSGIGDKTYSTLKELITV